MERNLKCDKFFVSFFVIFVVSLSVGIGDAGATLPPVADRIHIDPDFATTTVGGSIQFTAEARDVNNDPLVPQPAITWLMKDNDTTVGNIDNNGLFTAIATGTASIVAIAGSASGTADVLVGPPADHVAPIITLLGQSPLTVIIKSVYRDPGAEARDDVDGNITARISVTGLPISTLAAGTFNVTYNVLDSSGNAASTIVRIVNVVAATCETDADEDGDGHVDNLEILHHIHRWKEGGASNLNVLKSIKFWKSGSGC